MYDIEMSDEINISDFDTLSDACKALAHPARLAILKSLAQRGVCICGEIVDVLPLSQATVSQHLKVLKDARLITGEVDGPRSCYCVNTVTMRELRDKLGQLFKSIEDCC
jgi:ArsR family transcriptional regulator